MALNKRTYIVNTKIAGGFVLSQTLSDWCDQKKINYNTVLSRIWRAKPDIDEGVINIDSDDPLIAEPQPRGRPRTGTVPPRREPKNKVTDRHSVTKARRTKQTVRATKK